MKKLIISTRPAERRGWRLGVLLAQLGAQWAAIYICFNFEINHTYIHSNLQAIRIN